MPSEQFFSYIMHMVKTSCIPMK